MSQAEIPEPTSTRVMLAYRASLSFAMEQAGVPVVTSLRLQNTGAHRLAGAQLEIGLAPELGTPVSIAIDPLGPGEEVDLGAVDLRVPAGRLRTVLEAERAAVAWRLLVEGQPVDSGEAPIEILAWNEWPRSVTPPALLAVFVTPNHPVVTSVLQHVRDRLRAVTGDPSISAYQSRSSARALAQVRALYETVQTLGITYTGVPASFEATGQKVRLADAVVREGLATCLDVTLLFASCLEQMNLHPFLVIVQGHAFPGVWLIDERFPEGVVEDSARLRTAVALDQACFFDSSAAVQVPAVAFDDARAIAQGHLEGEASFVWALDVRVARFQRYRPLPVRDLVRLETSEADGRAEASVARDVLRTAAELPDEIPLDTPQPPPVADPVAARFRGWKDRLLDLSMRNKLLAFRADVKLALLLEVPDVAKFEDLLAGDRAFELIPRPPRDARDQRGEAHVAARTDATEMERARRADLERGILHVPFSEPELVARAVALDRAARTDIEEGGANTLFAAIGFLRWFEADASEVPRFAPLLLVPVALEYTRTTRRVRVRRLSDDPLGNQTLVEKLRRDFAVDLSALTALEADESGVDVPKLLRSVRAAVQRMRRWEVMEEVALGQFSFGKFLLWRDLDENAKVLLENPVVQHIAAKRGTVFPNKVAATDPATLDRNVPSASLPLVVDADSTQIAAIHSAVAGRSFVLQGPPGTGKSQTITNLIAAALAAEKTVLFVAEKMAALDVVHRRLRQVGLGDFCLELHSNKVDKKQVVGALSAALDRQERTAAGPWDARGREIDQLRNELNAYVAALHAPRPLEKTFYEATARVLALRDAPRIGVPTPSGRTEDDHRALLDRVSRLAVAAGAVAPVEKHPWQDTGIEAWSAGLQESVVAALDECDEAAGAVGVAARALAETLGTAPPVEATAVDDLVALGKAAGAGPALDPMLDDTAHEALDAKARDWIKASQAQYQRRSDLAERWNADLYERPLVPLHHRFSLWATSFVAFFVLFFARRELRSSARGPLPDNPAIARDLDLARKSVAAEPALAAAGGDLARRLAGVWDGSLDGLDALLARTRVARTALRRWRVSRGPLPGRMLALLEPNTPPDRRAAVHARSTAAETAVRVWRAAQRVLADGLSLPECEEPTFDAAAAAVAQRRANLPTFRAWAGYAAAAKAARDSGLSALVEANRTGRVSSGELVRCYERSFLEGWVAAVRDREPSLRDFQGPERHLAVERFRDGDREQLALGARAVIHRLEGRLPRNTEGLPETSEPGIIRREARKKRGHMPVRKLLAQVPNLLPLLKPCLLMSPLSVAQYLPATRRRFDLVVFDEASQICTHDAIGALARGNQVIVVGDSRQLPPTSFFQRGADEAPTDENDFDELESILEEATASGLPEQRLGWHYRSRHEALIDFSNQHYYDGRLSVFPAARGSVPDLGVSWHPVPHGFFDRGKTRTNRVEAETLVAHLVAALKRTPAGSRTFGVVTFSQAQQTLVSDLLDEARRVEPDIEPHFAAGDEPVFVKNLENVQGDERDEILFSVGYGPDQDGKMWMQFGPILRDGGERRLNVAVTRARQKLRVFSTMTHDQIDLARAKGKGAAHLKEFLRYVAVRGVDRPQRSGPSGDFDSDFERQVHDSLTANGWQVDSQVGCGRYRIDLAVVDPNRPGEYLLGVECDGAPYHSAATARDRDRLRQQVLEGLGWHMHRIWSTDWWFDREKEMERLEAALKLAQAAPGVRPAPPPAPVVAAPPLAAAFRPPPPAPIPAYCTASLPIYTTEPAHMHLHTSTSILQSAARIVLEAEAPIHIDELTRRLGAAFSAGSATKRARRRVMEVVGTAAVVRGEFCWLPGDDPSTWTKFRGPTADGTAREAELIAPEEVAAALRWQLDRSLSATEEDLARETAKVFGITRLGRRVAEAMTQGIDLLVARGLARREGDRVVRTRS